MKLGRLALYCVLGMSTSAAAVYALTPPNRQHPASELAVDAGVVEKGSASAAVSGPKPRTEDAALPEERDASNSASVDASTPDAKVPQSRKPESRTVSPASSPLDDISPECRMGIPDPAWQLMVSTTPELLRLPPAQQQAMREGSTHCVCSQDASGERLCHTWCVSKSARTGICRGICVCFL